MENSVDGYFGRSTAISILAWPLTNEFIKNKIFRITSINSINSINEFKELQFLTDYKNSEKPTEFNCTNCVSDLYSGYDQNVYNNGKTFKPPEWVLDQSENLIEEYGKDTEVYVTQVDLPEYQLRNIHRLLTERERVNIGMNNYNNQLFSWGKSYYSRYYNRHKELPPNIAVYCTSPCKYPNVVVDKIHIINCIGYAFDNNKQPDYLEYIELKKYFNFKQNDINKFYINRYYNIFRTVFLCANRKNLTDIYFTKVGAGAFSKLYMPRGYKITNLPGSIIDIYTGRG